MGEFEEGYVLGVFATMRLYRRAFERTMADLADVRRANAQFRREASLMLDAVQAHRIGLLAIHYGFDDTFRQEHYEKLRRMVEGDGDTRASPQNAETDCADDSSTKEVRA